MVKERRGLWRYIDPMKNGIPFMLFLRECEVKDYSPFVPKDKIISVPDEYFVPDKRKKALKWCKKNQVRVMFIIDDDITLHIRDESLSSKYKVIQEPEKFYGALEVLSKLCSPDYPMVGFPNKKGSSARRYMFEKNTSILWLVGFHVETLVKEKIDPTGLGHQFKSDRYMHLAVLSKGYSSLTYCGYSTGSMERGYKGGCGTMRSLEKDNESTLLLLRAFPNHTQPDTVVDKGVSRLYCRVAWKKFLKPKEKSYIDEAEGFALLKAGKR